MEAIRCARPQGVTDSIRCSSKSESGVYRPGSHHEKGEVLQRQRKPEYYVPATSFQQGHGRQGRTRAQRSRTVSWANAHRLLSSRLTLGARVRLRYLTDLLHI